jgi:DNA-binding transcriptional MerR regulator
MADYWDDIKKLRAAGCTLEQVREFLAANGVAVSVAAISKYIKRREAEGETIDKGETRTTAEKTVERQKEAAAEPAPKPAEPAPETDEEGGRLSAKQKRERLADQYIKPETTNSLFKKRNKE